MKFGVFLPSFLFPGTGLEHAARVRAFAGRAEDLGFDSLWITDHIVTAHQFYAVSWLDGMRQNWGDGGCEGIRRMA